MQFKVLGEKGNPVVVMLTGSFCPGECLDYLYLRMKKYHVIVPTYNGHYKDSKDFTTRENEAREIREYLHELGVEQLHIVRRRIEIGFNSEFNSRRLPIRSRSNIYDCTHISEQPHIIVALFGSRNYPVLKQGHDLFRLCNNRELKSQPFEL